MKLQTNMKSGAVLKVLISCDHCLVNSMWTKGWFWFTHYTCSVLCHLHAFKWHIHNTTGNFSSFQHFTITCNTLL